MNVNDPMEGSEMSPAGMSPDIGLAFDSLSAGMGMAELMGDAAGADSGQTMPSETGFGGMPPMADSNALIMDLPVIMKVVLGSTKMPLASVAKLAKGSMVKLDKKVGEPVDILVNGKLIARGELVVLDEEGSRFGVVLTQVGGATSSGR